MKKTPKPSGLSEEVIRSFLSSYGEIVGENRRSLIALCPVCGRSDKFYMLRSNGFSVCYHGSCSYGKKNFVGWLSLAANISIEEAKNLVYGDRQKSLAEPAPTYIRDPDFIEQDVLDIDPITYPEASFFSLDSPLAEEAVYYLNNRGISKDIGIKMGFTYNMTTRRLIMPIYIDGKCYGWQGRAIDKVEPSMRMRNNYGFRRDSLVMFHQTIIAAQAYVIAEGPFDALKFNKAGSFVATLGKVVTDKQFKLLLESPARRVYIGLDEDAFSEAQDLAKRYSMEGVDAFMLEVPESAKKRCEMQEKKADFGECTEEECLDAIRNASQYKPMSIFLSGDWKSRWN